MKKSSALGSQDPEEPPFSTTRRRRNLLCCRSDSEDDDRFDSSRSLTQYKASKKMHKAASAGDVDKVRRMLHRGKIDVNAKDKNNRSALHYACAYGHPEVVTLLMEMNCDIDVYDSDNNTALMKASQLQQEECTSILLEHGADPNRKDANGNTALHHAISVGNMKIAAKLISYGAETYGINKDELLVFISDEKENPHQVTETSLKSEVNKCEADELERRETHLECKPMQTNTYSRRNTESHVGSILEKKQKRLDSHGDNQTKVLNMVSSLNDLNDLTELSEKASTYSELPTAEFVSPMEELEKESKEPCTILRRTEILHIYEKLLKDLRKKLEEDQSNLVKLQMEQDLLDMKIECWRNFVHKRKERETNRSHDNIYEELIVKEPQLDNELKSNEHLEVVGLKTADIELKLPKENLSEGEEKDEDLMLQEQLGSNNLPKKTEEHDNGNENEEFHSTEGVSTSEDVKDTEIRSLEQEVVDDDTKELESLLHKEQAKETQFIMGELLFMEAQQKKLEVLSDEQTKLKQKIEGARCNMKTNKIDLDKLNQFTKDIEELIRSKLIEQSKLINQLQIQLAVLNYEEQTRENYFTLVRHCYSSRNE
ncbi:ankyrin repeat domain-containing protein 62-like isoform X1 [Dipodomys merriami]|uniref:ankyrin repeat domain-containing protein 62-like isoform X1 n=1 Tax=Dipodomys merriami TaxID=94247 RepID=UPI0038560F3A